MTWLSIIWGIFTLVFLALGCFQWKMAGKSVSHFQVSESPFRQVGIEVNVQIAGTDYVEFVDKFNQYIDYYNQSSSNGHKAQAIGYLVASATAIFSFVLTLVS